MVLNSGSGGLGYQVIGERQPAVARKIVVVRGALVFPKSVFPYT